MFTKQPNMHLLLVIALLVALTFAAPTPPETLDIINNNTSALKANSFVSSVVFPNGTVLESEDLLSNTVLSRDGSRSRATEPGELTLYIGTKPQHVGFTMKRDLPSELRSILDDLCDGSASAIPGPVCRRDKKLITGIANTDGSTGSLAVQVEADYIPNAPGSFDNAAILTLFQDQIVRAFRATINCDKNRYRYYNFIPNLPGSHTGHYSCMEMANSANFYEVALSGTDAKQGPHMLVNIEYKGKTTEGQMDCKGTLTNIWGTVDEHRVKYQYAKALGISMSVAINCVDPGSEGVPVGNCHGPPNGGMHCLGVGDIGPGDCKTLEQ